MKKTKIICTMGPACEDEATIEKMILAGMNVARFNFSHGTHESHKKQMDTVKRVRDRLGVPVAILLDTKGPEYRIGTFRNDEAVELVEDQFFTFTSDEIEGDGNRVSVSYKNLPKELVPGDTVLLNNGLVACEVIEIKGNDIITKVTYGGVISNRKSMAFPNKVLHQVYLSEKDKSDLLFGIEQDVDFVACSFVSSADDLNQIRAFMHEHGGDGIDLIAKIENQGGVDDMDLIMDYADGIMVARGDMGVEIPFIKLPEIQKRLIRKCVAKGKYVITATQMLESMTTNPRPTRAEISDVANAVYDGTSAVMLSGESAAGKYPLESVRALNDICTEAEKNGEFEALQNYVERHAIKDQNVFRGSICKAAKEIAKEVGAKAIIVESATGRVARAMVHYRPEVPVIAVVTSERVCRKLSLNWGVTALVGEEKLNSDDITTQAMEKALSTGLVKRGDTVVVLSSNKTVPTSSTDSLNIRIL